MEQTSLQYLLFDDKRLALVSSKDESSSEGIQQTSLFKIR
jgi:hypothetical protein